MDPKACFDALIKALADREWEEATGHADDLRTWISRGGFQPDVDATFLIDCPLSKVPREVSDALTRLSRTWPTCNPQYLIF